MRQEIREMTVLRAVAILSLFLAHLHQYIDIVFLEKIFTLSSNVCVGLFAFASGYCLTLGKDISDRRGIFAFLSRRLRRIYKLYIPALVIYILMYEPGDQHKLVSFAVHLASLQVLLEKFVTQYFTIWFIGMIVPYYVLFAFASYLSGRGFAIRKSTSLLVLFLVLYACRLGTICDSRFFFYAPCFIAGVFMCERRYLQEKPYPLGALLAFVISSFALIFAYFVFKDATGEFYVRILKAAALIAYALTIPLCGLYAAQLAVRLKLDRFRTIDIVSDSSFAAYLFHRPILSAAAAVFAFLQITNVWLLLALYGIVVFPVIVIPASYAIHKAVEK